MKRRTFDDQDNAPQLPGKSALGCDAHGCPAKWAVEMGSKLCSAHAFTEPREWPSITEAVCRGVWRMPEAYYPRPGDGGAISDKRVNPKGWAEALKRRHAAYEKLTQAQIDIYKAALRGNGPREVGE